MHTTSLRGACPGRLSQIRSPQAGTGPALVVVDGAMCQRTMGPAAGLAKALAADFAVHIYDRRNRGESDAGAAPWSVEREIEDLAAIIGAAGGSAHVFSASSGASLALDAAQGGLPIDRLALYEAPFILDGTHAPHAPRQIPEPLQFALNENARTMLVPTVGFGWITGDRQPAPAGLSECMLLLPKASDQEVDEAIERARRR